MVQRLSSDRRAPMPLPSDAAAREQLRAASRRQRERARLRIGIIVGGILLVAAVAGGALGRHAWLVLSSDGTPAGNGNAAGSPSPSRPGPLTATAGAAELGPVSGSGTFTFATSTGSTHGTAGALKRYRVAVENGSGQDVAAFATVVDQTLSDPRGWTGNGQLRVQRVSGQAAADFTVYLATPATSEAMCATGGLHTDQYTSCRTSGKIIINLARWLGSVPDYGAPLAVYQNYAINHEIGHELGLGHEACPGPGQPAPVMQQQTLGLKGCVANAWPNVNGQRYSGPKVP